MALLLSRVLGGGEKFNHASLNLKSLTARLGIKREPGAIGMDHSDLAAQLTDPTNLKFLVLDVFNPPDERLLLYQEVRTYTTVECFLEKRKGREVDTEVVGVDITTHFSLLRAIKKTTGMEELLTTMLNRGARGWRIAGLHDPPDKLSGWFPIRTSVQIVFQQFISERKGVVYQHKVKRLTVRPELDTVEVLELTPTLHKYGMQGYRLVCALNTPESRTLQRLKQDSDLFLFFERRREQPDDFASSAPPKDHAEAYKHKVVKCVVRVTHDASGASVKGDWKQIIKDQYVDEWTLSTILDVPDEDKGLTTLLLVFHRRARLVRHSTPSDSAHAGQRSLAQEEQAEEEEEGRERDL